MGEKNKNSIKKKVLSQIKEGKVNMRSKSQFLLKSILFFIALLFVALVLIYLVSFVFYFVRQSGLSYLPSFGLRGLGVFLSSFPWLLVLLGLVLLIALEILSHHYSFAYKTPTLYFVLITILIIIAAGFLVDQTGLHPRLQKMTHDKKLHGFESFYRSRKNSEAKKPEIGRITSMNKNGFTLEDLNGNEINIRIDDKTHILSNDLEKEDMVVVMGQEKEGSIQAFGVREVRAEDFPCPDCFPKNRQRMK